MPTHHDPTKPALSRLFSALLPKIVFPDRLRERARSAAMEVPLRDSERDDTHDASHTEASDPQVIATFDVDALARGLGLRIEPHERLLVYRAELAHQLERPLPPSGEPLDLMERARWTEDLLAARYILDHRLAAWRPELERPAINARPAYQKKDVPSSYGERLPMLVPTKTRRMLSKYMRTHHEMHLMHRPLTEELDVIFALEVGKYQHLMSEEDAALCQLSREQVMADARYMLFYQSYKIKPSREEMSFGKVRHYITREGLGASRAILLPDFDIDAARERGFAMVLSRDYLLVVEPFSDQHREEARAWCLNQADVLRFEERYIYPLTLFELGLEEAQAVAL